MSIVTTVATVSYRYYEKRNRSVAEQSIRDMARRIGRPEPDGLRHLGKHALVMLALDYHRLMPD